MKTGTVQRIKAESGDQGTFSKIVVGMVEEYLGELPWRDNHADLSCLAPGPDDPPITYLYSYIYSPEHKRKNYRCVAVINADGTKGPIPGNRNAAEIHAANLMGDILQGWAAQMKGCGGPGRSILNFLKGSQFASFTKESPNTLVEVTLQKDQKGVSSSQDALLALEKELAGEDVALTYSWI